MMSKISTDVAPAAYSAMSTTMMPFLYKTRTLAGLRWTSYNTVQHAQCAPRRSFRCSSRSHQGSEESSATSAPEATNGSKATEGASSKISGYEPSARDQSQPHVSDRKPDFNDSLQGERTRVPDVRKASPRTPVVRDFNHRMRTDYKFDTSKFDRYQDPDHQEAKMDDIAFEELDEDLIELGQDISSLRAKSHPNEQRESTITDTERHTFGRIFTDIFSRTQNSGKESAKNSLEAIIGEALKADEAYLAEDAAKHAAEHAAEHAAGLKHQQSMDAKRAAVERFPPALRAAAAQAIGVSDEEVNLEEIHRQLVAAAEELESRIAPERERVEALMRSASTDFELWNVLEGEVFSLVSKMEPKATPKQDESVGHVEDPLTFYAPIYASHLLLSLRLLDRSFSRPSPLTLSLLPRIKSLGQISHIIGASTSLYNELIRIYFHRFDDLLSVVRLVEEMDKAGLDFDEGTVEVLKEIERVQEEAVSGKRGDTLQQLWKLPEFKMTGLRKKVWKAIQEQEASGKDWNGQEIVHRA